jgi:hypothetical protein
MISSVGRRRNLSAAAASLATLVVLAFASAGDVAGEPPAERPLLCPDVSGEPRTPGRAAEPIDARKLVGKRMPRARRMAARHDCELRVVRRNGEWLIVTDDYRRDRANVAVRDRRVKRVLGVY